MEIMNEEEGKERRLVTINNLPDHCLWAIFEQFSLDKIVALRRVCRRWCGLINYGLKKQTSLKLFASKNDLTRFKQRKIEFNLHTNSSFSIQDSELLILRASNADWSQILCLHFPNITSLLIEITGNQDLQYNLTDAISKWNKSLKYLTLIGWSKITCNHFWSVLDTIPGLESVIFFGLYRSQIPNNLQCFRNLKALSLVHYLHDVVPVFAQIGSNVKYMLLSWIYLNVSQLEQIVRVNPHITRSLQVLRLGYISSITDHGADREKNFRQILYFFALNFINISQLSIIFADTVSMNIQLMFI